MADIFDVVADGTRRDILAFLRERAEEPEGTAVSQIVAELGVSQPTISKHLKVLREAGLVTVREEGQHRYYSLDPAPLEGIEDWLVPFFDLSDDAYAAALPESAVHAAEVMGRAVASAKHAVSTVWKRMPGLG